MTPLPEIIKPEWIAQGVFWIIVGVTLAGAVFAVFLKRIIHNILGLIVSLFGVAGLFIYLNSEFLALMEILIYVGAICISIVFAIMLSEPMYKEKAKRNIFKTVFTGMVAVLVFWSFSTIITKTPWEAAAVKSDDWSVRTIGNLLLTRYDLIFELISLVLLVAILGAIIIAGQGRKQRSSQ
ncbi:MAG: NADH-quinone oxidoreductase subunit J [Deltaproteobacteria bacterium]|nr:NADH-quinone oxidoreductase subunit J [Deltaproteobacteria bacterium]